MTSKFRVRSSDSELLKVYWTNKEAISGKLCEHFLLSLGTLDRV